MDARPSRVLTLYVTAVSLAGALLLLLLLAAGGTSAVALGQPGPFLLLLALIFVGELWPVDVVRDGRGGEITVSTPFIFACLVHFGLVPATFALVIACVAADLAHRRRLDRLVFNIGQYVISTVLAGATLMVLDPSLVRRSEDLAPQHLPPLLVAGAVFFLANHLLTLAAIVLDRQAPVRSIVDRTVVFEAVAAGALVIWSPIVLLTLHHELFLLPVLYLPAAAVHRGARNATARVHQALHDPLTGVANRSLFARRVDDAIAAARSAVGHCAVLIIDLDHFKEVNDTLGHGVGDLLLQRITAVLGDLVGPDAVARLGGDEFGVLLPHGDAAAALTAGQAVLRTLDQPFIIEDFPLQVEASIGIAVYPEHGSDSETLLRCADVALYVAKQDRGRCEVYDQERDLHSHRRLSLIAELREAIDGGQVVVHYQPKADLRSGRIEGVEALVRWQHPRHGMLPPAEFITLAERTVHIDALTRYVLETALEQCARWRDAGFPLRVAVNVPVQNLHARDFPDHVAAALRRWDIPAEWLELEITETTLMTDSGHALQALHELDELGVRLAIDDFGTGYSSLSYLRRMPVDTIKIDKSFVFGMATNGNDAVIVNSTLQLASSLGLQTVAEGVEDARTWEMLRRLGCDRVQGYFLSKPKPADELTEWFAELGPGLTVPAVVAAALPQHS